MNSLITPFLITGFWALVYKIMIVISLIGSTIFPFWYGCTGLWLKSDMGGHLFAYSLWSSVTMFLISIRPLLGEEPIPVTVVGIILVASLGFLVWWRAWLFYKHRKA